MRIRNQFAVCVCLLVVAMTAEAADPEKSLRETVQKFYQACIEGKWKTAEQYVDRESVEVFRSNPPSGFYKFQIQKVEFQKEGNEALVTLGLDTPVAQVGGKIMTLNAQTIWRASKGKWYMVISKAPPLPALMEAARLAQTAPKLLTELKFDYIQYDFDYRRQGDRIEVEFPFVNVSDHPVQVSASLVTFCDCITVKVTQDTISPGEKASVLFTLEDSTPFTFYYHQGIGVKVEPGGGTMNLHVIGFLAPAADNPPGGELPSERP
ncbi:MAG: DUF1573 domain-containing protein [Acidobacteria bacterium]|nr:DUF1573 domain-containing protein [Acidobacteriota bacterium]